MLKNLIVKLRQNLYLDKIGFIKSLRQNFVLRFVLTLRPLHGRLKSFLKYSIASIYILAFVILTKNTMGIYASYKSNFCSFLWNLHHSVSYRFPCSENIIIKMADSQ